MIEGKSDSAFYIYYTIPNTNRICTIFYATINSEWFGFFFDLKTHYRKIHSFLFNNFGRMKYSDGFHSFVHIIQIIMFDVCFYHTI